MSSPCPRPYVVGLGANLGDRLKTLRKAVSDLRALGQVTEISWLYETDAVGPPQPDYLNAAVWLEALLGPGEVLASLLEIERRHGRERRERWGPRTLDLDLLFSPEIVVDQPGLRLPHPELVRRAFALLPLLDVAPLAVDPLSGVSYAEIARGLDPSSVRRVDPQRAGRAEWALGACG